MAGVTPTAPLAAPEALREDHDTDGFDSGEPTPHSATSATRQAAFCNLIPGRSPARCASRTNMLRLKRLIFPFLISDTRA